MKPRPLLRRVCALAALGLAGPATAAPGSLAVAATAQILTPPAPATPRINGPGIFGVRPGAPFLYAIPATG